MRCGPDCVFPSANLGRLQDEVLACFVLTAAWVSTDVHGNGTLGRPLGLGNWSHGHCQGGPENQQGNAR